MELGFPVLVVATVLAFYCTGGAWMLLAAGYPVHRLVGPDEFAPFHQAFGRRLIAAFVVPSFLTYALTFWLAAAPPYDVPPIWALGVAVASALNLLVTFGYVVRKRRALAREGEAALVEQVPADQRDDHQERRGQDRGGVARVAGLGDGLPLRARPSARAARRVAAPRAHRLR